MVISLVAARSPPYSAPAGRIAPMSSLALVPGQSDDQCSDGCDGRRVGGASGRPAALPRRIEMDVEMKLEVLVLPVADVDRAKDFYEGLGWRLDADVEDGDDFRLVQMTPPGSPCSIHFGKGLTAAEPGSFADMHLVVSDLEATRADLTAKGVEVSEIFHCATGFGCRYRDLGSLL